MTALARRIRALPAQPGVYLLKSARGRVLYVGKAQNLRARVRSYLNPKSDGRAQVPKLMERVADLSVLVTRNVKDALLLENELIKQHRPRFNVDLRDDKQYLALRLDRGETWPRLTTVRRFQRDGARYFGPYISSADLRKTLANLRRVFPLRVCSDAVFRDYARRGRPCIEHEMKRCAAPCVGRVSARDYAELLDGTEFFLRGRVGHLRALLERRMNAAAAAERFEDAAAVRDQLDALTKTAERQQIVSSQPRDRDVFALARHGGEASVQALHVRVGRLVGESQHAFSGVVVTDKELLASFLGQYYARAAPRSAPPEVLLSTALDDDGALAALLTEQRDSGRVALRVPQRGAPRELLALAERNARLALEQRLAARESVASALGELQKKLKLTRTPRRIECYDVSNLSGTLAVASRVVFEDGAARTGAYRRYRVREAAAGDDLACLREVLQRRLARAKSEPLPDLLMLDGGRGQLGVASALLRDGGHALDHIGLAKERAPAHGTASPRVRRGGGLKAERIFLPNRRNPVLLPPSSRALLLLQRVRDEAHRFAIEFQRGLRRKRGLTSVLEEVPGIGAVKRRALLRALGSLRAVRAASARELASVRGISPRDATALRKFFDLVDGEKGE